MTNHWIDIKNADVVLIMGSNAAEHHPVAMKWILRAKDRGAELIHVDPKFSRTSARCDYHVPIRSGTDIAFLGGMINYILSTESWFREYVLEYTNASFVLDDSYEFKDGLFSGYDPATRTYDRSLWKFKRNADGAPLEDRTLENPRCVINMMRKHYSRYTLQNVSDVTGVSRENIMKVYKAFVSTGRRDRAGTILYAIGWTQHTVGVQNIRSSAIVQLLLGNIGVAGGGINALRGEPNVQGSTDHALLYHTMPGYLAMPLSPWQDLETYQKNNRPVTHVKNSTNWWGNKPKYFVSQLKGYFGDNATPENGFCYDLLPKLEPGEDYSYAYVIDKALKGQMRGGFIFGVNPPGSFPNVNKVRAALDRLDWLVVGELHNSESSDNWHRPGVNAADMKTEVFLLPSAHRVEKEGTVSNSGRWLQWTAKAVEPPYECRCFGDMYVPLFNRIRELYRKEGGRCPDQVLLQDWPEKFDPIDWMKRINGVFWKDVTINGKTYRRGDCVPAFGHLKDDGSTSSLCWIYSGSITEEEGNKSKKRDPSQTPEQAQVGIFPGWSWCWPVNRRILYNRASVDLDGKPWDPNRMVIEWKDGKWIGDIPDGGGKPMNLGGPRPFIMQTDGMGALFGPGRLDGPLPEHYEPAETPIMEHPFSRQLSSPCFKFLDSEYDLFAAPADPRYPIVLTTYSVTEHWCGGGETRNVPELLEAEPQLYIEMSPELAKEKGISNGDGVLVVSARGTCEAIAMVTVRLRPFTVMGKTVHEVGMPFFAGWMTPGTGDSTNRLTIGAYDPNTTIQESKACLVDIRKVDKLTEIAR